MRADAYSLDSVLREKQQWVVPVYQRHYEWETGEDRQIPRLWEDLREETLERLEKRSPYPHYFGAIIYSEPPNQPFGVVRRRFLVDGQQRITTFQLILAAIREVAREKGVARLLDVINAYLFNEKSASMQDTARERFKVWPSAYDRELYKNIVEHEFPKVRRLNPKFFYKNGSLIKGQSPNLLRAYVHLYEAIHAFVGERGREEDESAEMVLDGLLAGFLAGFQLVVIQLDQNDDAQEIFASLNGLGKPLSPFDLIRNDVFHRARKTGEDDEDLFNSRWKLFERPFWTEEVRQGRFKRARADHLIAHTLVAETAKEVNVSKIAAEYQRYARERSFPTVAAELDVLLGYAETYRKMEMGQRDVVVTRIADVLRTWDLSTLHPFVLAVSSLSIDDSDKLDIFATLEAYIVRREICDLTTKNYNKVVTGFIREIRDSETPLTAFSKQLSNLTGDASRMPTDLQVAEAFARKAAYARMPTPRLRYILLAIEHKLRTKFDESTVADANLTIEHVMPRRWAKNWPLPNGSLAPCESTFEAINAGHQLDDKTKALIEARQRTVDGFGNLTLLTPSLNPSIGHDSWPDKKMKLKGSLLALNREIAANECWGEQQIEQRAAHLASMANVLWQFSLTA